MKQVQDSVFKSRGEISGQYLLDPLTNLQGRGMNMLNVRTRIITEPVPGRDEDQLFIEVYRFRDQTPEEEAQENQMAEAMKANKTLEELSMLKILMHKYPPEERL